MVTATFGRHFHNNILVYLLPIRTVPALNNVIVGIFYFTFRGFDTVIFYFCLTYAPHNILDVVFAKHSN